MDNKADVITDGAASDNIEVDPSSASDEDIEDEDDDAYEISSATEGSEANTISIKQPLNKTGKNDSVTKAHTDIQSTAAISSKKRKRKRHFYNAIRQQIEFYFSDSNLSKDRFLQQVISKSSDSSVSLEILLEFNEIRKLTDDIKHLQIAIENKSELVELSDDQKFIRRIQPIQLNPNVDDCTIYVEALPQTATHLWLRKVFEFYGPVAYVSLPKYRTTGKIKEFAFVEFKDRSTVDKVIEEFSKLHGAVMSADEHNPETLFSIKSYLIEHCSMTANNANTVVVPITNSTGIVANQSVNESETNIDRKEEGKVNDNDETASLTDPIMDETDESITSDGSVKQRKKGRKYSNNENMCPPIKRLKTNTAQVSECDQKSNNDEIKEDVAAQTDNLSETDDKLAVDNVDVDQSKRLRRKNASEKKQAKVQREIKLANTGLILSTLRITTKNEWKRLRNKYLNLQRTQQKLINKQQRLNRQRQSSRRQTSQQQPQQLSPLHQQQSPSHQQQKHGTIRRPSLSTVVRNTRNINFYGALPNTTEDVPSHAILAPPPPPPPQSILPPSSLNAVSSAKITRPSFSFEPGIIVKVIFDQPCVDVKDFKGEMRQQSFVKYVDVKEGDMCAYVRVDCNRSAPTLIKHCAPRKCQILTGETAELYWEKIAQDREAKLTKTVKIKKVRGRDRIAKKQATHIRFED